MFGQHPRKMFLDKLAANLGIDETKLDQAFKEAAKSTAEEAFKNGYLTQEQLNRIKTRIEQGKAGGVFGRPWTVIARMHRRVETVLDAMAKRLGESEEDLEAQLASGKELSEIAREKGVSEEDLQQTIVSALKPQLEEAVKSGKITPKLAEAVLHRFEKGETTPKAA
ncbi:MAG TPA: hypothetical protein VKX96_06175 [Chloroflexota bacterium]|jgi:AraC-like DNA-binding protein|nr:hypothetical protein [Chloroflexota bacterium]